MGSYDPTRVGCRGNWRKYAGNPVLGEPGDFRFDNHVLLHEGGYRMYFSWRKYYSIAMTESPDGVHWTEPRLVLQPRPETRWEDDINRPTLVAKDGRYHMWYSGQTAGRAFTSATWTDNYLEAATNEDGTSDIGYAVSVDGIHWDRREIPVLRPAAAWERSSLMCPSVLWDEEALDCTHITGSPATTVLQAVSTRSRSTLYSISKGSPKT